jgi:predicted TIM-barrel fold metal-dependent hydrolase
MKPARIFDTHFHLIDPRFPLFENQGYLPPFFSVEQYRKRTAGLGIGGGVVVAGSFQGFETAYMYDALKAFGPTFAGVIQVPAAITDAEIMRLAQAGVRAVRFNLFRGGSAGIEDLDRLSRRVYDLAGWHAELYVDAATLGETAHVVASLPKVSIDHLGMTDAGLPHLLKLADKGVKVKATGFGRVDIDVPKALRALSRANPECLMFGSDLPSQRARRPFEDSDITLIVENIGDSLVDRVFWQNAVDFYRPSGL